MKLLSEEYVTSESGTIRAGPAGAAEASDARLASHLPPGGEGNDLHALASAQRAPYDPYNAQASNMIASPPHPAAMAGDAAEWAANAAMAQRGAEHHHGAFVDGVQQGSSDLTAQFTPMHRPTGNRSARRSASFDKANHPSQTAGLSNGVSGKQRSSGRVPSKPRHTCDFHSFTSQVPRPCPS
jgi:hypothetical protein